MTARRAACCDTCNTCWYGATVSGGGACFHNTTERLEYRCGRPEYDLPKTIQTFSQNPGQPTCQCLSKTYTAVETCCPGGCDDIVVRYHHFHHRDIGSTYEWWYQKPAAVFPPCINDCCGYTNDADCCASPPVLSKCSRTYYDWQGKNLSPFQVRCITHGDVPAKVTPGTSSNTSAAGCDFGEQYWWLQGIADKTNTLKRFKRYYWNTTTSPQQLASESVDHLSESLICVLHRSKWWDRQFNSLSRLDTDGGTSTDRAAAADRTPKYWVYLCAGIPLFASDLDRSSLNATEIGQIIEAVHKDEPFPRALAAQLVEDGILETPKDHGSAGGDKPILKTIEYADGTNYSAYFYARSGGWSFACHDHHGNPSVQLEAQWPQISLQFSVSSPYYGTSCLTSAPIPGNDCACNSSGPDNSCNACTPLSNTNCVPNPSIICGTYTGGYSEECDVDVVVGNCHGVRGVYVGYDIDAAYRGYSNPHGCLTTNFSKLYRYPPSAEPAVEMNPASVDESDLPDPDTLTHLMPWTVSRAINQGDSPDNTCCGGRGVFRSGAPLVVCPATSPTGDDCDPPTIGGG